MATVNPTCQLTLNEAIQMSSRRLIDYISFLGFPLPPYNQTTGKISKTELVSYAVKVAEMAASTGCIYATGPLQGQPLGSASVGTVGSIVFPQGHVPPVGVVTNTGAISIHAPAFMQPPTTGLTPQQQQKFAQGLATIQAQIAPTQQWTTLPPNQTPGGPGVAPTAAVATTNTGKWTIPVTGGAGTVPIKFQPNTQPPEYHRLFDGFTDEIRDINNGPIMVMSPFIRPVNPNPVVNMTAPIITVQSVAPIKPTLVLGRGYEEIYDQRQELGGSASTVRACALLSAVGTLGTQGLGMIVKPGEIIAKPKHVSYQGILTKGCLTTAAPTDECSIHLMYMDFLQTKAQADVATRNMNFYLRACNEAKALDRATVNQVGNNAPGIFMDVFNATICDPSNYSKYLKQWLPIKISGVTKVLEVASAEVRRKQPGNIAGHVFGLADFLANRFYSIDSPANNFYWNGVYNQILGIIGLICMELAFVPRNLVNQPGVAAPVKYLYLPYLDIDDFAVTRWDDGTLEVGLAPLPRHIVTNTDGTPMNFEQAMAHPLDRRGTYNPFQFMPPKITTAPAGYNAAGEYVISTRQRISMEMQAYKK